VPAGDGGVRIVLGSSVSMSRDGREVALISKRFAGPSQCWALDLRVDQPLPTTMVSSMSNCLVWVSGDGRTLLVLDLTYSTSRYVAVRVEP
jgi:hypothetical protein